MLTEKFNKYHIDINETFEGGIMKISEFYGKKVESTAGKRGYVISVNARAGKVECLVCADEDENEFAVDINYIKSIGDKIIYEDRESAIKASKPLRLGCAGFDEQGNFLGKLEDCTFSKNKLLKAKIGKKNYPAEGLQLGDIAIVKAIKTVKADVVSGGKIIIKKGTPLTAQVLDTAQTAGEYVQTSLKSL